jgi:hypothetical protein
MYPENHMSLKLEHNNKFSFLDTNLTKNNNSIQKTVHSKCITYNRKIPNDSSHPVENKQVDIIYLIKRMDN